MNSLPTSIITVFAAFTTIFIKPKTASKALLLLAGAILCRGGRTVCASLKILGMQGEARFDKYHRVLSRAKWSPLAAGRILLQKLIGTSTDPVVIAVDEHIERRSGRKIKAIGCYRDACRSTKKFVVRCFGLKWLTVMLLKQPSWHKRLLALPFLTILAPSEKSNKAKKKRHKTTIDWTRQLVKLLRRWLPKLRIILACDGGFANMELAWTCVKHNIALVTRLRHDACLFDFLSEYSGKGRRPKKGRRLLSPGKMFKEANLSWSEMEVKWYGGKLRRVAYATTTCLWGAQGYEPLPIRLVLLKDLQGEYEPIALMGIDGSFKLTAREIIELFVARWNQEVTHREVREHLGVETQRQWSDQSIARSTPVLFALYSLVVLMAESIHAASPLKAASTAWYQKETLTFADMLYAVRREIWRSKYFSYLYRKDDHEEIPAEEVASLIDQLAMVA